MEEIRLVSVVDYSLSVGKIFPLLLGSLKYNINRLGPVLNMQKYNKKNLLKFGSLRNEPCCILPVDSY